MMNSRPRQNAATARQNMLANIARTQGGPAAIRKAMEPVTVPPQQVGAGSPGQLQQPALPAIRTTAGTWGQDIGDKIYQPAVLKPSDPEYLYQQSLNQMPQPTPKPQESAWQAWQSLQPAAQTGLMAQAASPGLFGSGAMSTNQAMQPTQPYQEQKVMQPQQPIGGLNQALSNMYK